MRFQRHSESGAEAFERVTGEMMTSRWSVVDHEGQISIHVDGRVWGEMVVRLALDQQGIGSCRITAGVSLKAHVVMERAGV
jgi:hypothetical protein